MPLLVKDSVTLNKLANSFVNLKGRNYGYSDVLTHADTLATQLSQSPINIIFQMNEKKEHLFKILMYILIGFAVAYFWHQMK